MSVLRMVNVVMAVAHVPTGCAGLHLFFTASQTFEWKSLLGQEFHMVFECKSPTRASEKQLYKILQDWGPLARGTTRENSHWAPPCKKL